VAAAQDGRRARVDEYLQHLQAERRLSPHTVSNYGRELAVLITELEELAFEQMHNQHVRRAVARAHGQGLSGRSIARRLSAWRSFYRWLDRHHGPVVNPVNGVRAPRSPRALPKALSPDMAARLLDAPATEPAGLEPAHLEPAYIRDKAMFELFYSSGLRLAELIGLDLAAAGRICAERDVTVLGKGAKTRTVPVGAKAVEALQAWLAVRAQLARPEEPALFVGARGGRISPSLVQQRLRDWGRRLGLAVHPHMLRHSFASHVLQSSQDLRAVQELLGHASIAATQVYTHLDFQHLAKVYDAAHPRAKKK
jgi:integrase/recombinase XerC